MDALNVLALDGGGVRGLSSLLILRNLMQQVATASDLEAIPRPCEVFDLICGTSTGGLIALMLGRLRMTVEDAIDGYLRFSEEIFGNKACFAWARRLAGSAMYDASILEKCIKDIIAERGEDIDTLLEEPAGGSTEYCRTFVVAISPSNAGSPQVLFRSYPPARGDVLVGKCKIWEAARATTAASTFFSPMTMDSPPQTFIDGGLSGANNPSHIALEEVSEIFPGRRIGCFLSLGTGIPNVVQVKGNLAQIAKACAHLATSCENVADEVVKEFRTTTPEGHANPYFRFSVNRGLDNIMLDEWNKVADLTGVTGAYMRWDVQQVKAEKCVGVLKARIDAVTAKAREDAGLQ